MDVGVPTLLVDAHREIHTPVQARRRYCRALQTGLSVDGLLVIFAIKNILLELPIK